MAIEYGGSLTISQSCELWLSMRTCGLIKGNCAPNQHRAWPGALSSTALIAPGYVEIGGHSYRALRRRRRRQYGECIQARWHGVPGPWHSPNYRYAGPNGFVVLRFCSVFVKYRSTVEGRASPGKTIRGNTRQVVLHVQTIVGVLISAS